MLLLLFKKKKIKSISCSGVVYTLVELLALCFPSHHQNPSSPWIQQTFCIILFLLISWFIPISANVSSWAFLPLLLVFIYSFPDPQDGSGPNTWSPSHSGTPSNPESSLSTLMICNDITSSLTTCQQIVTALESLIFLSLLPNSKTTGINSVQLRPLKLDQRGKLFHQEP